MSLGPRQAENALGDDVALDVRGPTGDRARERPQVLLGPRAVAPVHRPGPLRVHAVRTERLHADEVHAALCLAAEQLEDRVFDRLLAPGELGKAAVPQALDGLGVDVQRRNLVSEAAVAGQTELPTERDQLFDGAADVLVAVDPQHGALVAERTLGDRP